MDTISQQAARLSAEWATDRRWRHTSRTYSAEDVIRLRGTVQEEYTLARLGAERLRKLLEAEDAVTALGAVTGMQAVQQVRAGLKAIYLSGWQVAADANLAGQTYPDQSLYPVNSVPAGGAQDQQRAAARRPDHLVGVPGRQCEQRRPTGWRPSWPTPKPDSAAC